MEIFFKELSKLKPSLNSTILKMVEEEGELSRAVLSFIPYIHAKKSFVFNNTKAFAIFNNIVEELLDVGQTVSTMLFVFEKENQFKKFSLDEMLAEHLLKLKNKKYKYDENDIFYIKDEDYNGVKIKKIALPKLDIDTDLIQTCLKLSEEAGELVQFAGKKSGLSGELNILKNSRVNKGIILELLDVAQCCVTMLYLLVDKYDINVENILEEHAKKLHAHGYC